MENNLRDKPGRQGSVKCRSGSRPGAVLASLSREAAIRGWCHEVTGELQIKYLRSRLKKTGRLTTLRESNEAENGEPQLHNKRGITNFFNDYYGGIS